MVGFLNWVASMLQRKTLRIMTVTSDSSQIDNLTTWEIIRTRTVYCVKVAVTDLKLVLKLNYSKKLTNNLATKLIQFWTSWRLLFIAKTLSVMPQIRRRILCQKYWKTRNLKKVVINIWPSRLPKGSIIFQQNEQHTKNKNNLIVNLLMNTVWIASLSLNLRTQSQHLTSINPKLLIHHVKI